MDINNLNISLHCFYDMMQTSMNIDSSFAVDETPEGHIHVIQAICTLQENKWTINLQLLRLRYRYIRFRANGAHLLQS